MAGKNYHSDGRSGEDKALDRFADMMIEKISTIQSDWKKPWFTDSATTWPKNLSGREYNGMNALMLMMHCEKEGFKIPVFMTFDRVVGLNYGKDKEGGKHPLTDGQGNNLPQVSVLKGSKSFPVFITTFTCVHSETKEHIKYDDYKQMSEEERSKYNVYPKLNTYYVFNVDQTNLKESRPELYQKLSERNAQVRPMPDGEQFSFPAVDRMIENNEWICPIKPTYGDQAYYSISKDEIVVPQKTQFKNGESFYSNLAHEMAHSTGKESELNRLKPGQSFGSSEYAREELVAELTAALVSQRYGMGKCIKEDSVPYLKNWLDSLKQEPSYIKTVLQDVKKASSMITQRVDKIQLELDSGIQQSEPEPSQRQQPLKDLGTYDVPEYALNYLEKGDATNLTEEEVEMIDRFTKENFPNGYVMNIDWGNINEANRYPAFGARNEQALTDKGESPYLAVKTISVQFMDAKLREEAKVSSHVEETHDQMAAKQPPDAVQQEEEVHFHRGR